MPKPKQHAVGAKLTISSTLKHQRAKVVHPTAFSVRMQQPVLSVILGISYQMEYAQHATQLASSVQEMQIPVHHAHIHLHYQVLPVSNVQVVVVNANNLIWQRALSAFNPIQSILIHRVFVTNAISKAATNVPKPVPAPASRA